MVMKSPAQGRRAVAPSSPQGRLQREVHSIQMRCQETLRRAKARKVEMEKEDARRRTDKEKYRVEIEENKRLREEAKLKEEERKRKEEKKLRLEMKNDVEKMIKGVEEAMDPPVHVAAVINADSAVPAPVPAVSDSEGEKKERKNMKKLALEKIVMNAQNGEGRILKELDLDAIFQGENKQVKDMKAPIPVRDASQELNLDTCQGDQKKEVERKNKEKEEQQKMKYVASAISDSSLMHHKGEKKQVKVQLRDSVRAAPKPVTENLVKPLVNKPVIENLEKKKEIKEGKKAMFQSELLPSVLMHHKIRVHDFCDYYNARFLFTMEESEKYFIEEDGVSSNKDELLDAFLESFNAPKWADLHNLNDHDDDIGCFFQSGCSQNGWP